MTTSTLINTAPVRPELGDFSSIICFRAVVIGIEDALGEKAAAIALISAGRARGRQIAEQLGLKSSVADLTAIAASLNLILGKEGTRLCIIDEITVDSTIRVSCRETICSSAELQGSSRKLTYTLGAIQGALEQMTGCRLRGKQIESVLRGSTHDVVEFEILT
ncbi:MAG: hypothetical protein KME15_26540 [Drouetiella hepatica Uher 2000/2452]|uniref:Hydrocarbon-binding protein n=1 Tax=Drouetiella hepatica Uher 2000/2452 TaxID=904376 RepID=A0A951UQ32_9CYAN|nr:hypothetical protein [Drouetiella hepatica Uher 2000/2452]